MFQNPRPSAWIWTRTLNVLSICEFSRTQSGAFLADCLLCTTSRSTKECKRHELSWFDIAIGSAFWSLQRPSFRSRLRERCLYVSTVSVSCATGATQTAVSDDCSGRFSMQVFNKLAKGPASAGVDREQQHLCSARCCNFGSWRKCLRSRAADAPGERDVFSRGEADGAERHQRTSAEPFRSLIVSIPARSRSNPVHQVKADFGSLGGISLVVEILAEREDLELIQMTLELLAIALAEEDTKAITVTHCTAGTTRSLCVKTDNCDAFCKLRIVRSVARPSDHCAFPVGSGTNRRARFLCLLPRRPDPELLLENRPL